MVIQVREKHIFLGVRHVFVPRGGAPVFPKFMGPLPTPKRFDLER